MVLTRFSYFLSKITFYQTFQHINFIEFLSDGQSDCGPDGEDEEDCEITEEQINKMRTECEAITMSPHIMCPNTLICIKQEWLCDGRKIKKNDANFLKSINF